MTCWKCFFTSMKVLEDVEWKDKITVKTGSNVGKSVNFTNSDCQLMEKAEKVLGTFKVQGGNTETLLSICLHLSIHSYHYKSSDISRQRELWNTQLFLASSPEWINTRTGQKSELRTPRIDTINMYNVIFECSLTIHHIRYVIKILNPLKGSLQILTNAIFCQYLSIWLKL